MRGLRTIFLAVCALLLPTSPPLWRLYARRLATAPGWMPTMMLLAIVFLIFIIDDALRPKANNLGLDLLRGSALMTWKVIAVFAITITGHQSARAIRRLGLGGTLRPRCWFELARVAWNVTALSLAGVLLGILLDNPRRQMLEGLFALLFAIARITGPAFFVLATVGYVLSLALRSPRTGRAQECIHYFYCLLGPIFLLTQAAILCPPRPNVRDIMISAVLVAIGIVWLACGSVSIFARLAKAERRRDAAR